MPFVTKLKPPLVKGCGGIEKLPLLCYNGKCKSYCSLTIAPQPDKRRCLSAFVTGLVGQLTLWSWPFCFGAK
jgi:hypothetical protein